MTRSAARPVVWLVCEVYYPEITAGTGWYVTALAEALAGEFDIRVIAARPNYAARGVAAPADELRNGVAIHRCATPVFDRHRPWLRLAGAVAQTASMVGAAWRRLSQGQIVIVVTAPPLLPYGIAALASWRGLRSVLYVHDLYPDALVCAGLLRGDRLATRLLHRAARWLYDCVDLIVTDGRDAMAVVADRTRQPRKVNFIPYWGEPQLASEPRGAADFVVLYSGNMGLVHDLETLLAAALRLKDHRRLRWILRGTGARLARAESFVQEHGISNIEFSAPVPWDELGSALAGCDVGIVTLVAGAAGVATPSRMYNLLAAGRPIVAVTDGDTELGLLVNEHNVGWVTQPGDDAGLASLLARLADDPASTRAAAERSLALGRRFTREQSTETFAMLLRGLQGRKVTGRGRSMF